MPETPASDLSTRIEIAGIIASGKTTLAGLFSQLTSVNVVLEAFAQNPFYEAFYRNPADVAFETELSFLLLHNYAARRSTSKVTVCDFAGILDRAYSRVTLTPAQIAAFDSVQDCAAQQLPPPTLIVQLICGPDEALDRVRRRQRQPEGAVTRDYLCALNAALTDEIENSPVPSLVIDSEAIDFRADANIRAGVLSTIQNKLVTLSSVTADAIPSCRLGIL